jgi:autotransporter-associated beta strand protein
MFKVRVSNLTIVALVLGLLLLGQSASAAVWTWSSSTSGPSPSDGSGTWNTSSANWWSSSSSSSGTTWVNGSTNTALFGVGNPASNPYTVSLGGGSLSTGGVTFQNQAYSLTLAGSGMLVLAASNGYGGGTTINGGTLQVNNINALGAQGIGGGVTDNAALCYNLSSGSIAGGISGTGATIYSGGLLTLTGAQYNSGATIVTAGTLALSGSASLGGTALRAPIDLLVSASFVRLPQHGR